MGRENECDILFRVHLFHQVKKCISGLRVKIRGRFICQHDGGICNNGSRNRHPLLLPPAHLVRSLMRKLIDPKLLHDSKGFFFSFFFRNAEKHHAELDVFESGQNRDQIVRLEHEPHLMKS